MDACRGHISLLGQADTGKYMDAFASTNGFLHDIQKIHLLMRRLIPRPSLLGGLTVNKNKLQVICGCHIFHHIVPLISLKF